ncbi:MAG: sulfatase-like hydrolase/transferase [Planctomycetes bacterium]|nr:sulfatase-like hydrolase/transferase [Planctomycetota bacterium]
MRALACALFVACLTSSSPAAERPNVLFLLTDDQRADTVAALGNPVIETPHLDRLARSGFRFTNAYCMGSMGGAVCVPSRAMINSGRTLFHVENDLSGARLLPEVLRNAGYVTFGTGKWHNGAESFLRGFEHGKAVFFGGMSVHTQVPLADVGQGGELVNRRIGDEFSSTLFADAAIEFLDDYESEAPFYCYVAFTAPHDPRQAPSGYLTRYDPQDVPLPENFLPQHPFNNGWMTGRDEMLAPWPRTERVVREQLAEYYGLIAHLDHEIGRVLAALSRSGEAENTLIVYTADHGLAMGSHGLLGKQNLYEHSMKSPLVFAGAGIPEGESDALVYLLDTMPTVLDVARVLAPGGIEGKTLAPIWRGDETFTPRDSIYTAMGQTIRAVRDDRWKFIRYPHINRLQLFDLASDPHELRNLADEREHVETVQRMTELMTRWHQQVDDPHPLVSDDPQPAEIDLTNHPRQPDRHQPKWIVEKYF